MRGQMHQNPRTALRREFWCEDLRIASSQTKGDQCPRIPQECTLEIAWELIQILVGHNHPKMAFACLWEEFDHRGGGHEVGFIDIEKVIASHGRGACWTAERCQLQLVHKV